MFYKEEIFKAIQPYCKLTVSGQGIDIYLIPCLQKILGLNKITSGIVKRSNSILECLIFYDVHEVFPVATLDQGCR